MVKAVKFKREPRETPLLWKIKTEFLNPPQEIREKKESRKRSFRFSLTEKHDRVWFNDNSGLVFLKVSSADEIVVAVSVGDILIFSPRKSKFVHQMRRTNKAIFWVLLYQPTKVPPAERSDVNLKETCAVKETT